MTEVENQTLRLLREMRTSLDALREDTGKRLAAIEKSQDRFRVRIALLETRHNDLTGDLAAIARIVERAKLLDERGEH